MAPKFVEQLAAQLAGALARIGALESAVSALQSAGAAAGEQLTPTYLTISPATGLVSAFFSGGLQVPSGQALSWLNAAGVQVAQITSDSLGNLTLAGNSLIVPFLQGGLLLVEQTGAAADYGQANSIGWLDSGGSLTVEEFISGMNIGGSRVLYLQSVPGGFAIGPGVDYAQLGITATHPEAAGFASLFMHAQDSTLAIDHQATLLDSKGRSSFANLGANGASPQLSIAGSSTLTWAGGTTFSNVVGVALPGATGTVVGVATSSFRSDSGGGVDVSCGPLGGGAVQFQGKAPPDVGVPANGVTCDFDYLIWGT